MIPKRRTSIPPHFEQPFSLGPATPGEGTPVVGAIIAGPLGALVHRAFSTAFAAVVQARARQATDSNAAPKTTTAPAKSGAAPRAGRRTRKKTKRPSDTDGK